MVVGGKVIAEFAYYGPAAEEAVAKMSPGSAMGILGRREQVLIADKLVIEGLQQKTEERRRKGHIGSNDVT